MHFLNTGTIHPSYSISWHESGKVVSFLQTKSKALSLCTTQNNNKYFSWILILSDEQWWCDLWLKTFSTKSASAWLHLANRKASGPVSQRNLRRFRYILAKNDFFCGLASAQSAARLFYNNLSSKIESISPKKASQVHKVLLYILAQFSLKIWVNFAKKRSYKCTSCCQTF